MPTPLVDIDANPRQPGFRPTKEGSKIPNPPKFQRYGSKARRNPFSVSTTGSPSYTTVPVMSKAVVSPPPTSKLPRKSMRTQNAFSKSYTYGSRSETPRESLPRAQVGYKPTAIAVPSNPSTTNTIPLLSCNKPLPSPPLAQIVNPASPLKAQRTLVDAEAGTPTDEAWPILQPDNVLPMESPALLINEGITRRIMSEGSTLRRNGIPILESRVTTPLSVDNRTPSHNGDLCIEDDDLDYEKFRQMKEPRDFSSTNPYAKSFHAYSTNSGVAINSPLAQKQSNSPVVIIPPRISSKRSSLLSPDIVTNELPAQPPAALLRSVKPSSTKWPVLGVTNDSIANEQPNVEELRTDQQHLPAELELIKPASFGGADAIQSHHRSIDSASTWSLAAELSLDDAPEVHYEGSLWVKRLLRHPSNNGSGPTLRISADADAILLGRHDSIPAFPAFSRQMLEQTSQERALGTLSGRVSKQVLVKMTSATGSRTPTPSPIATETIESRSIRVTPIRSMQPPRKPSIGDLSRISATRSTLGPTEPTTYQDELILTQVEPCSSIETSSRTSSSQAKLDAIPQTSKKSREEGYGTGNYSTMLQNGMPEKATHVPGTDTETFRKRLPMTWMIPKSATFTLNKSGAIRSKTSPLLRSAERLITRVSVSSTRSPSPASSSLARSTPSKAGAHRLGPSRLGATESMTRDLDPIFFNNSSKETQTVGQNTADIALRIKTKRSFGNIFRRRDPTIKPHPTKRQVLKRSSVAGSALTQCIRNSIIYSEVSLARPSETESETKQDVMDPLHSIEAMGKEADPQTAPSAREYGPAVLPPQPEPPIYYDTANLVHKILDHVTLMEAKSPDRLRGIEIAEAILHAVECFKEAKSSAGLATKHARDAELNAERAGIELKRLEKLCGPSFDDETIQWIKQLTMASGIVRHS